MHLSPSDTHVIWQAALGVDWMTMDAIRVEMVVDTEGTRRYDVTGNGTLQFLEGCAPLPTTARAAAALDADGRLQPLTEWIVRAELNASGICAESESKGGPLSLRMAMRTLGRAVRRDDAYEPPAALDALVTDQLTVQFATAEWRGCDPPSLCLAHGAGDGAAGVVSPGWALRGVGRRLGDRGDELLVDQPLQAQIIDVPGGEEEATEASSNVVEFNLLLPAGEESERPATLGYRALQTPQAVMAEYTPLAKAEAVVAVGIEGDVLTDPVMEFPSLRAEFAGVVGAQPGPPLNVKGSARWVEDAWQITDASLMAASWDAPLGLRFVKATHVTAASGLITGVDAARQQLQALNITTTVELTLGDGGGCATAAGVLTVAARERMTSTDWCLQTDERLPVDCVTSTVDSAVGSGAVTLGGLMQQIVETTTVAPHNALSPLLAGVPVERISRLARTSPVCEHDESAMGSGWAVEGVLVVDREEEDGGALARAMGALQGTAETRLGPSSSSPEMQLERFNFTLRFALQPTDARMRLTFRHADPQTSVQLARRHLKLEQTVFTSALGAQGEEDGDNATLSLNSHVRVVLGPRELQFPVSGAYDAERAAWVLRGGMHQDWRVPLDVDVLVIDPHAQHDFRGEVDGGGVRSLEVDTRASVAFAPGCVVESAALSLALSGEALADKSLRWCLRAEQQAPCSLQAAATEQTSSTTTAAAAGLPLTAVFDRVRGNDGASRSSPPLLAEVTVQAIGPVRFDTPGCTLAGEEDVADDGVKGSNHSKGGWTIEGMGSVIAGGVVDAALASFERSALSADAAASTSTRTGQYRFALHMPEASHAVTNSGASTVAEHARLGVGFADDVPLSMEQGRLVMHEAMLETTLDPAVQEKTWQLLATMEAALHGSSARFSAIAVLDSVRNSWVVSGAPLSQPWERPLGMSFLHVHDAHATARIDAAGGVQAMEAAGAATVAMDLPAGASCEFAASLAVATSPHMADALWCVDGTLLAAHNCTLDSGSAFASLGGLIRRMHASLERDLAQPSVLDEMRVRWARLQRVNSPERCAVAGVAAAAACCVTPRGARQPGGGHLVNGLVLSGAVTVPEGSFPGADTLEHLLEVLGGATSTTLTTSTAADLEFMLEIPDDDDTTDAAAPGRPVLSFGVPGGVKSPLEFLQGRLRLRDGLLEVGDAANVTTDGLRLQGTLEMDLLGSSLPPVHVRGAYSKHGRTDHWTLIGAVADAKSAGSWTPTPVGGLCVTAVNVSAGISADEMQLVVHAEGALSLAAAAAAAAAERCELPAHLAVHTVHAVDAEWCLDARGDADALSKCVDVMMAPLFLQLLTSPEDAAATAAASITRTETGAGGRVEAPTAPTERPLMADEALAAAAAAAALGGLTVTELSVSHASSAACFHSDHWRVDHTTDAVRPQRLGWTAAGSLRAAADSAVATWLQPLVPWDDAAAAAAVRPFHLHVHAPEQRAALGGAGRLVVGVAEAPAAFVSLSDDGSVQLHNVSLGVDVADARAYAAKAALAGVLRVRVAPGCGVEFFVMGRRSGAGGWELTGSLVRNNTALDVEVDVTTPRQRLPTALAALKDATVAKARLVVGDELQRYGLELAARVDLQLGGDCEAEAAADFILHMGRARAAAAANRLGGMVWHANTSFPATCLLGMVETGLGVDAGRAHDLLQTVVVKSAAVQVTLTGGGGGGGGGGDGDGDAPLETWHGQPLRRGAQVHVNEATLGAASAAHKLFVALVGQKVRATLSSRKTHSTVSESESVAFAPRIVSVTSTAYAWGFVPGAGERSGGGRRCKRDRRRSRRRRGG